MITSKDNDGHLIGWWETYLSKDEIVDASVNGNMNTITTKTRTKAKVLPKAFFGKPLISPAFYKRKK